MRLVFVNRYYWPDESATSLMLTDLAQALAADGHSVQVVTSRQLLEDPAADLPLRQDHRGVNIRRLRTTRFGRSRLLARAVDYLSFYMSALLHLLCQLRRGDVVVAKTDPPLIGVVATFAAMLRGARVVNWLQDVYPEIAFRLGAIGENSLLGNIMVALRNWSMRRAWASVVVGDGMKTFFRKAFGSGQKLTAIHNWSQPLAGTSTTREDNMYRRQLGLENKTVFCYSGNLGRAHEFDAIIEAATLLRGRNDIHFLIIGGGARISAVREQIQHRGLSNWSFLPYQPRERLADSLGAADVHLVTLNPAMEGLIVPSKIYGVLASGRPCIFIGDTNGEVARLLSNNGCGISVSGRSATELQAAIQQLTESAELRSRLGSKALFASQTKYSVDHALNAWRRLLAF